MECLARGTGNQAPLALQIGEGLVIFPEPQTEAQHSSKPVGS